MPIDFECPGCLAVLRVEERFAGRSIRCPACDDPLDVPLNGAADWATDVELDEPPFDADEDVEFDPGESGPLDRSGVTICNLCGTRNYPEDVHCRNCGEALFEAPVPVPREDWTAPRVAPFGLKDVLQDSWQVYREEFGPCLLGYLLSSLLWGAGLVGGLIPIGMVMIALRAGPVPVMAGVVLPMLALLLFFVTTYSIIGLMVFLEHIVRSGEGELSLLFHGSRYLARMMLLYVVMTLMVGLGLVAFVIPGIVAYTVYWPAAFVLVDQDCGVFEALERGRLLSRGHRGTLFAVTLVGFLIWLGSILLGLGMLLGFVTAPLSMLLTIVTYLRLAGHVEPKDGELVPTDDDTFGMAG